ncbi:MAG: exodeoxyribonuclease V subunit alpha [Chlamydiia bacterium]
MFLMDPQQCSRIAALLADDGVLPIDFAITSMILERDTKVSEHVFAFVCKLALSARLGHLCLKWDGKRLVPDTSELMENSISSKILDDMAVIGMKEIPKHLIQRNGEQTEGFFPVIELDACFYLQKNAFFEARFTEELLRIASYPAEEYVDELSLPSIFNQGQKVAVSNCLSSSFSVITGGPGTGKTFIAAQIVRHYILRARKEGRSDPQIVLAAPTGKAAMQLEASVRRSLDTDSCVRVGTLHFLLSIKSSQDMMQEPPALAADLVIVDEASMIDARLFFYFLSSVQPGTKVILIGDKDQLPPIDSGSLFADLVDFARSYQGIPCYELTECLRSDRKPLLELAKAINLQDRDSVKRMLLDNTGFLQRTVFFHVDRSIRSRYEDLWAFCQPRFPFVKSDLDPLALLQAFDRFRILSCIRKGALGVDAMNQFFAEKFSVLTSSAESMVYPILIKKNQYALDLFNGDVGVLVKYKKKQGLQDKENDVAYFYDKQSGLARAVPSIILPDYEYAYCLSIHKSQGSEYDDILILAQEGSQSFGKEVLYTAVTRAKNRVFIDISDSVLEQLLSRSSRKISGLHGRLRIAKEITCSTT